MGAAFSTEEKKEIQTQLIAVAKEMVCTYGMKKTSVDEIVQRVGISKGMFYKLYPSKEMLFFEMLETFHSDIYGSLEEMLKNNKHLSEKERLYNTFYFALSHLENMQLLNFMENELQLLLRKIPDEILETHYHSDEVHIKRLIEVSDIKINISMELLNALVRTFLIIISEKKKIGKNYDEVKEIIIDSFCDKILGM